MTCQPLSSDAQPARIRLTSAQDWLGSADETFTAGLSLALTPDNVQKRFAADTRPCCGLNVTEHGRIGLLDGSRPGRADRAAFEHEPAGDSPARRRDSGIGKRTSGGSGHPR